MRTIDIKTSHNIVLKFELASLLQRIFATAIDLVIVLVYYLLVALIVRGNDVPLYLFALPATLVFHLFFELFNNGQTPGKALLKIRVVSLDGKPLTPKNIIIRWAFRLVDIGATLGLLATLSIFSSQKSQRLGDLLANTTVINTIGNKGTSLLKLTTLDKIKHQITYPAVVMYNDEDMILIKDVLHRMKTKNNPHTIKVSKELVTKIKADLKIPDEKVNVKKFLHTVVDDYIMLTR